MTREEAVAVATQTAMSFLGLPYVWGGDDPVAGFDCSGFVIELLKSVGMLPGGGDWSAQGLWQHFANNHNCSILRTATREGCLVFFHMPGNTRLITHVEYAINDVLCIGASGGGRGTTNRAEAIARNAYIKIRPWGTRDTVYGVVDPFMIAYGGGVRTLGALTGP